LNPNNVLDFNASGAVEGIPVTPILPGAPTIDLEGEDGSLILVSGGAVLDAFGALVLKGNFEVGIGQVTGNDAGTDPDVSFTDADAFSLTLTNVELWAGSGGSFDAPGAPDDYSTATIVDGDFGFSGSADGVSVVAINNDGANYLGATVSGLSADLVGMDDRSDFTPGTETSA
jgi:hypothetical protein